MADEQRDSSDSWMKFLNPQVLRSNLISVSIYIAAWETFENGVIDELEGFYLTGFNEESGPLFTKQYEDAVLSRDKSRFRASMLWLKESGTVDDADLELADRARLHRNDLAHNLPAYLAKSSHNVDVELLDKLCTLLDKNDVWWIRNVHIPTNEDFDDRDVDAIPDSEITSGNMLFLTMLFKTATGDEAEATKFYEEFAKRLRKA